MKLEKEQKMPKPTKREKEMLEIIGELGEVYYRAGKDGVGYYIGEGQNNNYMLKLTVVKSLLKKDFMERDHGYKHTFRALEKYTITSSGVETAKLGI